MSTSPPAVTAPNPRRELRVVADRNRGAAYLARILGQAGAFALSVPR